MWLDVGEGIGVGEVLDGFGDAQELLVDEVDDFAALFFRVAMGAKFGVDVGAFGPGPEELVELLLGFGLGDGKALLFEGEAAGDEFAASKGDDAGEELVDLAEFGIGVVGDGGILGKSGKTQKEVMDEVIEHRAGFVLGGRGRSGPASERNSKAAWRICQRGRDFLQYLERFCLVMGRPSNWVLRMA